MEERNLDRIRQQYLKRALSIIVRDSRFEGVSTCSLDVLCNISILYMQSMFAQVHAYAEHATRTRPNMNDVGRALDERNVSIAQLDAYHHTEIAMRTNPVVASAVFQLNNQVNSLTGSKIFPTHMTESASSAFFDDTAEGLLQKLVKSHVKTIEEKMERERLEERARKHKAEEMALASINSKQNNAFNGISGGRPRNKRPGRVRINVDGFVDQLSDDEESNTYDIDDIDDDMDSVDNNNNDNYMDDAEGEEDADFEAPTVNMSHIPETTTAFSNSTCDADHAASVQAPAVIDANRSTDTPLHPENAINSDQQQQNSLKATPDLGNDDGEKKDIVSSARLHIRDIERALLPSSVLPPYIPSHCPLFPSPHTYKRTPVFPKREQDFFRNRMHKAEQSRQAEENLQRLISSPLIDRNKQLSKNSNTPPEQSHIKDKNEEVNVAGKQTDTFNDEMLQQPDNVENHQTKQNSHKRIQHLFPPANFRNVHKRTQLTGFIN
ncbi:transcription initiation factor TFIID subunit 8 [Coemansia spiralis]|uniref:Transcription initiation factor TFIID subunit 8 n=2 Tax=Coemansia TaxID=4863 RepID=A0A9W8G789_9FUNG|nr:transcription initiation factor TFIID subunit 8 [Coemansia umbellata]KAJ2622300.1 transcription initiation factor TFIID subunit 8 [Coemansia sp. RSA 1358]KAJ2677901.1 transcription initiation factor TFIID subunit 8 [Coemansia spiralis]